MKNKEWNPNIDLVKGVLILLVIFGHIIPRTLSESFSKYAPYKIEKTGFIEWYFSTLYICISLFR
jgi:fucose 4-O-acetylase-like acetyltransferase